MPMHIPLVIVANELANILVCEFNFETTLQTHEWLQGIYNDIHVHILLCKIPIQINTHAIAHNNKNNNSNCSLHTCMDMRMHIN